jgi:hypothetical protein
MSGQGYENPNFVSKYDLQRRIAELEAELSAKSQSESALTDELADEKRRADDNGAVVLDFHAKVIAMKYELAALKARRCDGCKHWQLHRPDTFDCDIEACGEAWLDRSGSFSCSEWEAQP